MVNWCVVLKSFLVVPDEQIVPSIEEEPSNNAAETPKALPKKGKRGRKSTKNISESPVKIIKEELSTDVSQTEEIEEPLEPVTKKRKRSSTGRGKTDDTATTSSEPEFSVRIKSVGRKPTKTHKESETETEDERKQRGKKKEKKKDRKRSGSSTKLVVSFKMKPSDKKSEKVSIECRIPTSPAAPVVDDAEEQHSPPYVEEDEKSVSLVEPKVEPKEEPVFMVSCK